MPRNSPSNLLFIQGFILFPLSLDPKEPDNTRALSTAVPGFLPGSPSKAEGGHELYREDFQGC